VCSVETYDQAKDQTLVDRKGRQPTRGFVFEALVEREDFFESFSAQRDRFGKFVVAGGYERPQSDLVGPELRIQRLASLDRRDELLGELHVARERCEIREDDAISRLLEKVRVIRNDLLQPLRNRSSLVLRRRSSILVQIQKKELLPYARSRSVYGGHVFIQGIMECVGSFEIARTLEQVQE
jgi:hypothetical protein